MPLLYVVLWIVLSGTLSWESCLCGVIAAVVLTVVSRKALGYRFRRFSFRCLWKKTIYFLALIWEIILAALRIIVLIWRPKRELRPQIIYFDSGLQTNEARALLADSITLTAGTITVAAEGSELCVHTLDQTLAEGMERCGFVRRLRELEEEG
ncbi:Na+/H+ antiporter subunit E [Oscillibacter sp. MSJ-2]|uniref:Na+/H+ antiporter subunit E n=1 Tax=Dysosmobacter acutus TaxID=2841504 RepID=A0ABS6F9N5_9FIRM|nr:Na+/H+ antiporter subunit E [Dysosmobacter acutus]MBU5626242.1 Na+/H+ antiporter subunit E [Dysosmobacter acutus]